MQNGIVDIEQSLANAKLAIDEYILKSKDLNDACKIAVNSTIKEYSNLTIIPKPNLINFAIRAIPGYNIAAHKYYYDACDKYISNNSTMDPNLRESFPYGISKGKNGGVFLWENKTEEEIEVLNSKFESTILKKIK